MNRFIERHETYWKIRAKVSAVVTRLLAFRNLRSVHIIVWDWESTAAEMRWVVLEPFTRLAKVVNVMIQKQEKVGLSKVDAVGCG